jgi:hypothetical protein
MDAKSDHVGDLQPRPMPAPEGFQVPDLGFPVNQAAPMVHAIQQFAAMPQMCPQHPEPMNGYYMLNNEMLSNYAIPNAEDHVPNHGVMSNFSLQQPIGGLFFHPSHEAPQNFVQQSNGPNFFPGQAVINVGNHYHQSHEMMPNSNPQQYPIIDPLNQQGMVRHLNGHMYSAVDVLQKVLDGGKRESQAAKQADRARMERNRLGDCTPPRAAQADKRRLHEQGMSQHFKQEDMSGDATQRTMDEIHEAQCLESPGGQWVSYDREMTPAQRRSSMVSNSMSRSLSTPKKIIFATPSTPKNFEHPSRKRDLPNVASPSKRQKTCGLKRNSSWHQGMAVASSGPVPGAAMLPSMPFTDPSTSVPMAASGPTAPSFMSIPAPAVLLSMPAPDQITASFMPASGPPVSYSISAPGHFAGSFVPESDPPVMCSLGISGRTASASMSGSGPPISCSLNAPSPSTPASMPASGSAIQNGTHPAAPQGFSPLLSPGLSAEAATLPPSAFDKGSLDQDIDEEEEDELLLRRYSAAPAAEITAWPPAQEQNSLQPPHSTVAEASIQEGFLPAGDPDVGPPVFGEGEFLTPNYGLEDQNGPSNVPSPLRDAGFLGDFDQEEGEYDLGVRYS